MYISLTQIRPAVGTWHEINPSSKHVSPAHLNHLPLYSFIHTHQRLCSLDFPAKLYLSFNSKTIRVLIPETTFVGVESRVRIPETTFVGVESRVLIPETTFVGVESRVLIPETTFVGVESRVLIPETTVWDTLVYPSDTLVIRKQKLE
ncbi:hypothetical protein Tco_1377078 [Tanacetum coccineum]